MRRRPVFFALLAGGLLALGLSTTAVGAAKAGPPAIAAGTVAEAALQGTFENDAGWIIGREWYLTYRGEARRVGDAAEQNHESVVEVSHARSFDGKGCAYGFSGVRTDGGWHTWEHGTRTWLTVILDLSDRSGVRLRMAGQSSARGGVWGWCNEVRGRLALGRNSFEVPLWVDHEAPFKENGNYRVGRERGTDSTWWDVYEIPVPRAMRRSDVRFSIIWSSYAWRNFAAVSSMESFVDGIEVF